MQRQIGAGPCNGRIEERKGSCRMRSNDKRLLITTLLIIITAAAGFAISQDHADAAPSVPAAPIPAVSNAGLAKQPVARAVGVPAIRPRARIAGAAQPQ